MLALGPDLFERLNADAQSQDLVFGRGGMSGAGIEALERELGFALPQDLKFLFRNVLHRTGGSPWASLDRAAHDEMTAWVLQGVEFDVEASNLWLNRWGEQPKTLAGALDIARRDFATWPRLLSLFGHRFLAVEPCLPDNPVFSVMQTDIVYYGANLAHYLVHELLGGDYWQHTHNQHPRRIEIWSDFAEDRDAILAWPSGLISAEKAPWRAN